MNNSLEFLTLINVEYPQYKIGDKVRRRYINDDEIDIDNYHKLRTIYGVIVGMIPNYKSGKWEYFIMWNDAIYDFDSGYTDNEFELN